MRRALVLTFAGVALLAVSLIGASGVQAVDGTWNVDGDGDWSLSTNWLIDTVADGSDFTADFSALDITADTTVSLDTARTIGNLTFGDTETATTAAGWTLDNKATPANILTLAGTAPTVTVDALGTDKVATIGAVIAGSDGLTKAGDGTLVLSAANTYTGGTVVDGGRLSIGNDNRLGVVPGSFDADNITINNGATLQLAVNGLALNANRGIALGPGVQNIEKISRQGVTINGVITGDGGLNFADTTAPGGDGGGGGRFHLYGANTYTGDTTITYMGIKDPGIWLHNSLALQNSTLDYKTTDSPNNGDWDLLWFSGGNSSYTLGGLKGDVVLNLSPQGNTAHVLKVGNNNQDTTFSGVIRSTNDANAGITKIGTGTLTLTGANTYSGETTVSDGTLLVNNTSGSGTGSGQVLVNGGVLGGTGTIGGNLTVNDTATVAPGNNGIGELTVTGNSDIQAGGTLACEVGGAAEEAGDDGNADLLEVSGTAAFNTAEVTLDWLPDYEGTPAEGVASMFGGNYTLANYTSATGTPTLVLGNIGADYVKTGLTVDTNDLTLELQPQGLGDTDLDADVDGDDLATFGLAWSPSGTDKTWFDGDFDFDGDIDGDDLAALGLAWAPGGISFPAGDIGVTAVPEPCTIVMLLIGMAGLLIYRKRR